ncbi:MAG: hypothetical protein IKG58_00560 [Bacilli bacterium]|nr:hypothetical protein [Bacilli bacterium]MBR3049038.1 hypothetical protein [Bacilli bacterium]
MGLHFRNKYINYEQSDNYNNTNKRNKIEKPNTKKSTLSTLLTLLGIAGIGVVAIIVLFGIEKTQIKSWQNGKIEILNKKIQLPCSVRVFEKKLNTNLIYDSSGDEEKSLDRVKISTSSGLQLNFKAMVESDQVVGITLEVANSKYEDVYNNLSSREAANKIKFPGGVTINTPIKKIRQLYDTKPFNVYYKPTPNNYHYIGNGSSINFQTRKEKDGEKIYNIQYSVK